MDETPVKPTSHLTRLSRYLLAGGLVAVLLSTLLQWQQLQGRGPRFIGDGYGVALMTQLLMVLGTVALTGAVFGYVLLAVRRDRETSRVEGHSPDASWHE
jgi:hypothetical protein